MANLLIKLTGEWFTHHVPCYPDNLCFNIHLQKKSGNLLLDMEWKEFRANKSSLMKS